MENTMSNLNTVTNAINEAPGLSIKDLVEVTGLERKEVAASVKSLLDEGTISKSKNGKKAATFSLAPLEDAKITDDDTSASADEMAILAAEGMAVDPDSGEGLAIETEEAAAAMIAEQEGARPGERGEPARSSKPRKANVTGIVKTVCNVVDEDDKLLSAMEKALEAAGHTPGALVRKGLERALAQHGLSLGEGGIAAVKALIERQPATSGKGGTGGSRLGTGSARVIGKPDALKIPVRFAAVTDLDGQFTVEQMTKGANWTVAVKVVDGKPAIVLQPAG